MAELTHVYDFTDTTSIFTAASQGSWTNTPASGNAPAAILGSALTANTKYLIIARAISIKGELTNHDFVRVSTADDTTIAAKSESRIEAGTTGDVWTSYMFIHSYTTDATPADIEFQAQNLGGASQTVRNSELLLLDLDAIGTEGTDYYEDIQAAGGGDYSKTADTTVVAQLLGSDMGTAEHLILGYAAVEVNNAGRYYDHSLHACDDEATAAKKAGHRAEGEDTNETRLSGFAIRHKASSGTPNVTLYGASENGGGAQNADGGGYLIALPASIFEDGIRYTYVAGTIAIDTTETNLATISEFTPTTAGNHMVFGRSEGSATPTANGSMWVQNQSDHIRFQDRGSNQNQMWDTAKDNEQQLTFQRHAITTNETLELESLGVGADFDAEHRWLVVVNLAFDSGPGPTLPPERLIIGVGT